MSTIKGLMKHPIIMETIKKCLALNNPKQFLQSKCNFPSAPVKFPPVGLNPAFQAVEIILNIYSVFYRSCPSQPCHQQI